jgi:hypothetical protein
MATSFQDSFDIAVVFSVGGEVIIDVDMEIRRARGLKPFLLNLDDWNLGA